MTEQSGLLAGDESARLWFSLLAPGYDPYVSSVFWPESLQRDGVERLEVDSGDRVLDIGCGTGQTATILRRRGAEVHGLDSSHAQLRTALEKDELEDTHLVQANGRLLPYRDRSFDRVVSIGSILYWAEPSAVLEAAHRVAKPGGRILVLGFHKRPMSLWNPIHNAQNAVNSMLFVQFSPSEATRLFEKAGWREIDHEITGPDWSTDLVLSTTARKPG